MALIHYVLLKILCVCCTQCVHDAHGQGYRTYDRHETKVPLSQWYQHDQTETVAHQPVHWIIVVIDARTNGIGDEITNTSDKGRHIDNIRDRIEATDDES